MILQRTSVFRLAALGLILAMVGTASAYAAAAKKKKPEPPPPPDPRILVSKVDVANHQVIFNYKRTKSFRTYLIDDLTAVTVSGSSATLKDITVGLQVFDYVERDAHSLDKITVGTPDSAPVAGQKK